MTGYVIKTDTDVAYSRGRGGTKWPVERFVAAINGVWLTRKDGGLRKFKTRRAARIAARKVAEESIAKATA
jgi:hypothetical protein